MLQEVVYASLLLFFIFDPLASLPIFLSLTEDQDREERRHSADMAVMVAMVLFLLFVTIGEQFLSTFGISMDGFRIAGGLVLLLMGLEIIFGLELTKPSSKSVAWVIMATPVLSGPGVITTAILLVSEVGYIPTLMAGSISLLVVWLFFRNASRIVEFVGNTSIAIMSRIIGLMIAALGIDYMVSGLLDYIGHYPQSITLLQALLGA